MADTVEVGDSSVRHRQCDPIAEHFKSAILESARRLEMTTSETSAQCAKRILEEDTRRTIGLIRYYKERLALETARLQKTVDAGSELREEGRVLREHNAVLEAKCGEMKKYLNFVGDKRRRFREAYYGIADQEDFEIRDSNRMLRDLIVVSREITEILKLTHKAERDAVEQVAREEEQFRESIREVLTERNALKTEILKTQSVVDADEEKRKIAYDNVKFLERKIDAQQAELALLDDRKENAEIQLIAVREEIKRRCPQYVLPSLPGFMDGDGGDPEKKDKPEDAGGEGSKKKNEENDKLLSSSESESSNRSKKHEDKKSQPQTSSPFKVSESGQKKSDPKDSDLQKEPKKDGDSEHKDIEVKVENVDKQRSKGVERSADSLSDEEDLLSCPGSDSYFTTAGSISSRSSLYQEALDLTQEDEDEAVDDKISTKSDEEPEEPIVPIPLLADVQGPLPPPSPPIPLKATLVNLNSDMPTEQNSEREVEAPLYDIPNDEMTQEGSAEGAPNVDVTIKTKLTLFRQDEKNSA